MLIRNGTGIEVSRDVSAIIIPDGTESVIKQGEQVFIQQVLGGMFTVLKVRDTLTSYKDPGWYDNPAGTLSISATGDELRRDGIDPKGAATADPGST